MQSQPSVPRPEIYDETVFKLLMEYEVARSIRYETPLSLLRIGLALLNPIETEINNAPAALASMLNMRLRGADVPARIGDEFAVLLPSTNESAARSVCERLLRITLGTQNTPLGFATRVTICIGLASRGGHSAFTAGQIMEEAMTALRHARSMGPQTYRSYTDTMIRRTNNHGG